MWFLGFGEFSFFRQVLCVWEDGSVNDMNKPILVSIWISCGIGSVVIRGKVKEYSLIVHFRVELKKYIRVYMRLGMGFTEKKKNISFSFVRTRKYGRSRGVGTLWAPTVVFLSSYSSIRLIRPFVLTLVLLEGVSIFLGRKGVRA